MKEPLLIHVIAFAPTAFYHCMHCEVAFREMGKSNAVQKEQLSSSLPEDLLADYAALSDWVRDMLRMHCDRIAIRVIDAASVEGVWASLRFGASRYPAVIVDRHGRFSGKDAFTRAAEAIGQRLSRADVLPAAA